MVEKKTTTKDSTDLNEILNAYLKRWPWFILSVLITLGVAYTFLRYSTNRYQARSKVMIKDTSSGGISETWALSDLDVLGNTFNTVENEIEVLLSIRLMEMVIRDLRLETTYSIEGRIKSADLYRNSPFLLNVLDLNQSQKDTLSLAFDLNHINSSTFQLRTNDSQAWNSFSYGKSFEYMNQSLVLSFDPEINDRVGIDSNDIIRVNIYPVEYVARNLSSRLSAVKTDKRSSVLDLAIIDDNYIKAKDILNKLVEVYNEDAIKDKNTAAKNTAQFIDERLIEVQADLDSIERKIQKFKNSKGLVDLPTESLMGLEASAQINRELAILNTNIQVAQSVEKQLRSTNYEFLPANLSINNSEVISQQAINYNELLGQYLNLTESATAANPSVIALKQQIDGVKDVLLLSLSSNLDSLQLQKASLLNERGNAFQQVVSVPENERLNRDIERARKVVETIFLLLSEKRETTAISLAIATPKAKVVDFAIASTTPVYPRKNIIYLAALIVGLLLPVGIIYLRQLLYNKIENRREVEEHLSDATILGEIPRIDKDENDYITLNDRSILAESFRIVRTNLQYIIASLKKQDQSPVVLVTSTVKGEGKTFVSYNTALTLAYTGKKVLLIGADIRNPQIHRYVGKTNLASNGLTDFLINDQLTLSELLTTHSENTNLDLVHSGKIPPNPAELLLSDRVKNMIEDARNSYDYIIIDSAPTILVTDTFLINKYADVTMYVTRANYTDKVLLNYLQETIDDKKLENVSIVVNDVKVSNFGYGRKYTYEYSNSKKGLLGYFKAYFNKSK
ncbi:hypothetical protein BST97_06960 [Nonlabens spongiae]|uniref:non-specific protein-tyrosine kinase n=1 Tax=Nonlabens spongiae TaxID=331648 RepID=A0A1W6MJK7_9FLAO|nr:tyrosine-protein kinase [Nonlabens spongiae]ARN77757.1 hypothetical protein BST97_06960 [Nonlabens spongiae]